MKIRQIGSSIVHIVMPDRNSLAKAMYRLQEYYESPFPEIRGQIFTLGFIKSLGSRSYRGVNTYCGGENYKSDWSGYNFPSYVLDPFIKGLFDPLTSEEKDIVETLRYRQDKFYVIGTYGDDDPGDTLEHEIRHALYYISDAYKKEVDKALGGYTKQLVNLKKCLLDWGYCKEVLDDECHAYMGPDYEYFFTERKADADKYKVVVDKKLSNKLNAIAKKHKKKIGL
jgi:hypothetical protein